MEIPTWINTMFAFYTALALPIIFYYNFLVERRKHQHEQRSSGRGLRKLACDATKSTATIAGFIGVWVVFLWTLSYSVASYRSAHHEDRVSGILTGVIFAVVGVVVTLIAVVVSSRRRRDRPTTDNDN